MSRICYDVTLKGYTALDEGSIIKGNEDRAEVLFNELVKWIVAPHLQALEAFLNKNDLINLLDAKPFPMSEPSHGYGIVDGVDFILDENGKVLQGNIGLLTQWRELIAEVQGIIKDVPHVCPRCGEPLKNFMQEGVGKTLDEVFGCPKCD